MWIKRQKIAVHCIELKIGHCGLSFHIVEVTVSKVDIFRALLRISLVSGYFGSGITSSVIEPCLQFSIWSMTSCLASGSLR